MNKKRFFSFTLAIALCLSLIMGGGVSAAEQEQSLYKEYMASARDYLTKPDSLGSAEPKKLARNLLSLGDYEDAPLMGELMTAWGKRDLRTVSDLLIQNPELASRKSVLNALKNSDLSIDDNLAILTLYNDLNPGDISDAVINPPYGWSDETDGKIFTKCGKKSQGKVLICVSKRWGDSTTYYLPYDLMAALPEELVPSSLAEVGYVVFVSYDHVHDDYYDNDVTEGVQENAAVTLYSVPGKKVVKSYSKVSGKRAPDRISYNRGAPPALVSGGEPDNAKVRENVLAAINHIRPM